MTVGQFENELAALHIPTAWNLFGFLFFVGQIGFDLSAAAIVLLLRRTSQCLSYSKENISLAPLRWQCSSPIDAV